MSSRSVSATCIDVMRSIVAEVEKSIQHSRFVRGRLVRDKNEHIGSIFTDFSLSLYAIGHITEHLGTYGIELEGWGRGLVIFSIL